MKPNFKKLNDEQLIFVYDMLFDRVMRTFPKETDVRKYYEKLKTEMRKRAKQIAKKVMN